MENTIKMDDLGVPQFSETPISLSTISTLLNFREKDYHALLLLITDLTSCAASVTI